MRFLGDALFRLTSSRESEHRFHCPLGLAEESVSCSCLVLRPERLFYQSCLDRDDWMKGSGPSRMLTEEFPCSLHAFVVNGCLLCVVHRCSVPEWEYFWNPDCVHIVARYTYTSLTYRLFCVEAWRHCTCVVYD